MMWKISKLQLFEISSQQIYTLFFNKNIVFKNIQARTGQKIKNILRISSTLVLTIVFCFFWFFSKIFLINRTLLILKSVKVCLQDFVCFCWRWGSRNCFTWLTLATCTFCWKFNQNFLLFLFYEKTSSCIHKMPF